MITFRKLLSFVFSGKLRINRRGRTMAVKVNSRNIFDLLCSYIWTRYVVVLYIIIVLNRAIGHTATSIITTLVYVLLFAGSLPYMITKLKIRDFLAYLGFAAVYIVSMMYTETRIASYLSENLYDSLIRFAPLFLVGVCIRDENTVEKLHTASMVSIFTSVFFLIIASRFMSGDTDYMSFSYYLLPHISLVFFYAAREKRMMDIAAVIAGFMCIIIYGTRGPFLALAVLFLVYFIFFKKYKHRVLGRVFAISMILIVFFFVLWFLFFYGASLTNIVLRTKILDNLTLEGFFNDGGRYDIAGVVTERIIAEPFAVRGLAADRILTNSYGVIFHYSHNIILELVYSLGVVFGGFAIINIAVVYIRSFLKCNNREIKGLILVLITSTGFFKLLLSGTFLLEPFFFFLIGICVGAARIKKGDGET